MDITMRKTQKQDYPLLDNFLYEVIFIPEIEGKIVVAVWVSNMNDYGHIDDETPYVAIIHYGALPITNL